MVGILFVILFILMLTVGGERGLTSFFALLFNILILIITIYMIVLGINPLIASFICASALGLITLFYQNGFNEKTIAAFKSVVIITMALILFAVIFCIKTGVAGLNEININEEDTLYLSGDIQINMMMITVPMIVIGLMGAIIDTAIAVSSAAYEVVRNNPLISENELFLSGMNIGKSILGSTMNTLIFAMIGESLMLFNLLMRYKYSFFDLINSAAFVETIAGTVFSAIGCALTIPLTSYIFMKQSK